MRPRIKIIKNSTVSSKMNSVDANKVQISGTYKKAEINDKALINAENRNFIYPSKQTAINTLLKIEKHRKILVNISL